MYAVIETGSKQYRVEVGTELEVELLDSEPGQTITLDRVLLVADGDTSAIGRPIVDGATVSAEVLRRDRGEKLISFKYRPKARRRVKKGHRQELTILRVSDIVFGGKSAADDARKAAALAKTERERLEEAAARQAAEDSALAAKLAKSAAAKTDAADKKAAADAAPAKGAKKTTKTDTKTAAKAPSKGASTSGASTSGGSSKADTKTAGAKATAKTTARPTAKPSGSAKPSADAPKRASRTKKDD
jgi:large subunit ribosomal protein L21